MLYFYQHFPEYINPIAFSIGSFDIRWYSLMYLLGFAVVYLLLKSQKLKFKASDSLIINFMLCTFIGLIIGARLGYALFYNLSYFVQNPLAVISPFNASGNFTGIFGMSYFGGLIGIIIASVIFCRRNKINFFEWADFIIPAVPAGYFFGRIGNFLNGELYGKATNYFWGMHFNGEPFLRHPTQLYEASLEGIALFIILWFLRNKSKFPGHLLSIYLFGYGIIRFFVEYLREQDQSLIWGLSRSQFLSLVLIAVSVVAYLYLFENKDKIVKKV
jgi:phosphatidylglycerol:prolipoprotein diacylglycerol transferase